MKKVFLLSGEKKEMAKAEVLALAEKPEIECIDNVLIVDCDFKYQRLALTKKVYDLLFECHSKDLEQYMKEFRWKQVYKRSFSLRIVNIAPVDNKEKEAELAKYIWEQIEDPKVDLKFAKTKIELIVTEDKIICGKVICDVKQAFNKRRAHLRPENHPTSLHPKLARACVNLTGIKTGRVLMDPFCGSGGILIEAGLMRFNTIGYDLSEKMIKMCEKNLDHFKVKRFKLDVRDATQLSDPVEYVVTDLPYGRNSLLLGNMDDLYGKFLKNLKSILREKAVIMFPDNTDFKKLVQDAGFKIEHEFSHYLHKSLSKRIVLIS